MNPPARLSPQSREQPAQKIASATTNNAIYAKCEVNGKEVTTLVDTGAAVTLIHRDVFNGVRTVSTKTRPATQPIVGANNSPLTVRIVADVHIELAGVVACHEVHVCDDLAQDMLIGTDFLQPHQFLINFEEGKIVANGKTSDLISKQIKQICRVTVAESITIPPHSMTNIACKVDRGTTVDQMTGVLEPESRFEERYSVGIIKVATTVTKGTIPVRIFNSQSKPRRIYRGSSMGNLIPLTDSEVESPWYECVKTIEPQSVTKKSYCMAAQKGDSSNLQEEMSELFRIDNTSIPNNEKERIYDLLARHSNVVSRGPHDLGKVTEVKHSIPTGDSSPIRLQPRRIPFHQREEIQHEVEVMLSSDVIEPSTSPWCAPVILVRKKDGSKRFCVDYRKLNEVTKKDVYPLPRCEDILHAMSGAAYFTHLDLVRGYWQISVDEMDREKTAFSTPDGHYEFKRMPFGLTNAPATFQRAMNTILRGLNWLDCLVYLDDIIIFAGSLDEHYRKLDTVLSRLGNAGLKLNARKCHFLNEKTVILGHIVSREGIATDPDKIKALQEWPTPGDLTNLRSFLGCAGYYRQFIPRYADIAAPLYKLEQKGSSYIWSKECEEAFETLKNKLTTAPVLAYPVFGVPFILDTDASNDGLGAVLSQVQQGNERVIGFAAKSLSKAERNYSTTRKELLAMIWGMEHFEPYLWGHHFTVRTDHSALKWLQGFKNPKAQVARWLERLAEFDFTVQHRPGKTHGNADGMSRIPWSSREGSASGDNERHVSFVSPPSGETAVADREMALYQVEDPTISQAISWVKRGERPLRKEIAGMDPLVSSLWSQFSRLKLVDGILYREYESEDGKDKNLQICLPRKLIPEILNTLHDIPTSGHLGINKMTQKVKARYYWKGWERDIEDHCHNCGKCATHNPPQRKARAPLVTSSTGYPMERVALDVIGPLPQTERNNRFILVISDYFTRWVEAYPIPDHKAPTVARKLVDEWISRYGVMQTLHSDQGRDFESNVFKSVVNILGVHKTRTTPYHPESDGLVERFNRTLKSMLSKTVDDNQRDWDILIPQVLMAYRTSVQSSTGVTPFRMMFGREARLPVDLLVASHLPNQPKLTTSEYVRTLEERFHAAHELARDKTGKSTRRYKDYYDARTQGTPYGIGDRVWRMVHFVKKGLSKKLAASWEGPYVVIKKVTDVVYRLKKEGGRKRVVVHFNNLKKCYTPRESEGSGHVENTPAVQVRQHVKPTEEINGRHHNDDDDDDEEDWIFEQQKQQPQIPTDSETAPEAETTTPAPEAETTTRNTEVDTSRNDQSDQTRNRPSRCRKRPIWTDDYDLSY